MITSTFAYLSAHPVLASVLALTVVLALIGLWYVIFNHFRAILVTLLCGAGLLSGIVVVYRGAEASMSDLVAIGLFLIVAFPVIFAWAIRSEKKAVVATPHLPGGIKLPGQGVGTQGAQPRS